ncbi:pentapeptide repeat protein [Kalymmatonema gypsitolerans NIES-4073]|nr:pentapeptide repeat protein [Scytonema sp. NIES-4073]
MKGFRFHQQSLSLNLEGINAGQPTSARKALIVLITLLYFSVGFLTSYYETLISLFFIVGTDNARLSISLLTLIVITWVMTAIFYSSDKNLLITLLTFLFAIAVQQVIVKLFPKIFTKYFLATFLFDTLLPFTITFLSFLAIRFAIALIDILWYKPASIIVKNFGILIVTLAAVIGAFSCLSIQIQTQNPKIVETMTPNVRTITVLIGVSFSCLITLTAWIANRFRNAPWDYSGLLRALVLAVGCWRSTSFYDLDLSGVNLRNARLANTDLRARKLYRTCLQGVTGLERARVDNRYLDLELPNVQKLLVHAYCEDKNFNRLNLRGAYLQGADLRRFDFTDTELTGADLRDADLRGAILLHTQVMGVDFTGANLTGICIEDWSVNSQTLFTNVQCDYIYRKLDEKEEPTDRYPADRNFEPREFESLYQEVGNVVELVFKEGVNWRAFTFALQKLHLEDDGLGLELKGLEKRGDLWVVKVSHNENVPTKEIEQRLNASYEELKQLLSTKEQQINSLLGIATNQAEAIKEFSKRPLGNSFFITGSTITNLAGSGQIEYNEAADQVRNIVANSSDQVQVTTTVRNFLAQLQGQSVATTTGTQAELIKQVLLNEADKDPIFKQLLVLQGQQLVDAMQEGAITTAIRGAIAQLH